MNFITKIKNLIPNKQQKVLLGRWTIDYNEKTINKKLDLSNEDHCGSCNRFKTNIDIKKMIFFETI